MIISKERFKELLELQESGDDTIDYSDIPELDDDFWENATYRGADSGCADCPDAR